MQKSMESVAATRKIDSEDMFGSWSTWGDTFAFRDAQRQWEPEGIDDLYTIVREAKRDMSMP
eukprot:10987219-Karenia_brevis.AAC.1